ncbi:hypothetical protein BH10ACI3_BH10ACI3_21090 [soil metagenome]
MKITRRRFLEAAPIAAGVALQLNGSALGQGGGRGISPGGDLLSTLGWNSFLPYTNTSFSFRDSAGSVVDLRLTNMIDQVPVIPSLAAKNGECFQLVFTGPTGRPLKPDVYSVEHFALGNFDLLISVGTTGRRGITYEAVINRNIPA